MNNLLSKELMLWDGLTMETAQLLKDELSVYTCEDLLRRYPFRYENRSKQSTVAMLNSSAAVTGIHLQGYIKNLRKVEKGKKKLIACFEDETGRLELIWFQKFSWVIKSIKEHVLYRVWGKPNFLPGGPAQLVHPEIVVARGSWPTQWVPLYHTTERLKKKLDAKGIAMLQRKLLKQLAQTDIETLPSKLLDQYRLISLKAALINIHFPDNHQILKQAQRRLKFEELFYIQLKLLKMKYTRIEKKNSKVFNNLSLFRSFYHTHLPFDLTTDQKKVIRDIYRDLRCGKQMNRLLQGDVGSGKTIIAFLSALIVVCDKAQVAVMAPTEILARQHYERFYSFASLLNLPVALLTGSTKKKERTHIVYQLQAGLLPIVVGTHALLSNDVVFKELGFFVIDEQHRFGVVQRAGLLAKNKAYMPHILIMTATPIPRTLSMTFYGDLDHSTIYTLPEGRQPIKTHHYYENFRLKVFQFLREQLNLGRQVYVVYPLIEASAVLDYHNLLSGYESMVRAFPDVPIGIVHGKMDSLSKEIEMKRFESHKTAILIATTVIEVGIHVANATVMVIESAERFGLSQLHQLRGRVGRGSEQSYCILMTDYALNKAGKERIDVMVKTNNGFEIAEWDLKFRGPGDVMGLQQSGALNLKIADLATDTHILDAARQSAKQIIQEDPDFQHPDNLSLYQEYTRQLTIAGNWNSIG